MCACSEGRVAYATEQEALMVRNALAVDPEVGTDGRLQGDT